MYRRYDLLQRALCDMFSEQLSCGEISVRCASNRMRANGVPREVRMRIVQRALRVVRGATR